jgi:hypothetical protein
MSNLRMACLAFALLALASSGSLQADDSELPALGPWLIRVERVSRDQLSKLLAAGVPVVMELRQSLFVAGTPDHLSWLDDRGHASTVLDTDAGASDYLVVGLRPDTSMEAVRSSGTELYSESHRRRMQRPRGQRQVRERHQGHHRSLPMRPAGPVNRPADPGTAVPVRLSRKGGV